MLKIFDPIFQKNYYFSYTKTQAEHAQLIKESFNKVIEVNDGSYGNTEMLEEPAENNIHNMIIWVQYTGNDYIDNNTIGHEIFHAVEGILEYCGVSYNPETSEVYAYVIGYLTGEIFKEVNKIRELEMCKTIRRNVF